jgi:DNA invertase Pin-like site-specific DNA recombinase
MLRKKEFMMSKTIGYARVSTMDQNINSQLDFLNRMQCEYIYQEKISATSKDRIELQKALKKLSAGDTLIVLKLDRLGRSVMDLIQIIDQIKRRGAHLKTSDGIDTSTPYGTFIFHIFSALAEMELALIRERTKMGLIAARMRGRVGGRPKGLNANAQKKAMLAETLYQSKAFTVDEICSQLSLSKATLYKYLHFRGVKLHSQQ